MYSRSTGCGRGVAAVAHCWVVAVPHDYPSAPPPQHREPCAAAANSQRHR